MSSWELGQQHERGRVRPGNEDWLGSAIPEDQWWMASKGALFVVADGIGGRPAGATASQLAVTTVIDAYYRDPHRDEAVALERAVEVAHRRIMQLATSDPASQGLGTTVVSAAIRGAELVVAHVGDSRAYLARAGWLWPLTRDHTWVAEMVAMGSLTPEQAASHPWRHWLTRYLGNPGLLRVDTVRTRLLPGDALLLCTDGVSDYVWEQEMAQIVGWTHPAVAAQHLAALANARGGRDNITVLVVRPPAALPGGSAAARPGPGVRLLAPAAAGGPGVAAPLLRLATGFALAGLVIWLLMLTMSITL